jgi:phosphoribosylglycinamide formyltransferase-1
MGLMRITVLVSGRGSNLAALIAASRAPAFKGAVTHVISNKPGAGGLRIAEANAIATSLVDSAAFDDRAAFDAALSDAVDATEPDLIVLAGFMRVLRGDFVERHAGRLLNIHPSLLPSYPGLATHRRALADGVRIHGCTVHFVTAGVDSGPIVAQAAVPVRHDDDEATLAARVLAQEHRLLPAAVRWFCAGQLALEAGRARLTGVAETDGALCAPSPGAT